MALVPFRVGFGYDVHQLAPGLKLVLGGIVIPHEKGPVAHSDGDVLIHAICDALLGAAALGDIGKHFPDNSNDYKGISSLILLERTIGLVDNSGYELINVDSTLCLQRPKIMAYVPQMIDSLAKAMKIEPGCVSVKATTTEKLGFVGTEQGVEAYAVVLIQKK
jgi:2-C-methyl-D-erythritol 2,4-cyclodiphosphate synthase